MADQDTSSDGRHLTNKNNLASDDPRLQRHVSSAETASGGVTSSPRAVVLEASSETTRHRPDPNDFGVHGLVALAIAAGNWLLKVIILCVVLIFFATALFLNYWSIHLYILHKTDPCEQNLAMWLYVSGVSGLLGLAMAFVRSIIVSIRPYIKDIMPPRTGLALNLVNQLNNFFGFVWLVYGSVLVYSIDRPVSKCPADLLNFTFYFITFTWGVAGGTAFLAVLAGMLAFSVKLYRTKRWET